MSVLRRHIKLEHVRKWSLRRSYRRANVVDVDIPEEVSQFAELMTLTEDVGRNESVIFKRLLQGSRVEKDGPMEGGISQERTTNAKRRNTNIELEQKEQTEKWRTT